MFNNLFMKNDFETRFNQLIEYLRVTRSELSRAIDVSPQSITNWVKRNSISKDSAKKIEVKYGISANWILYGDGEMKAKKILKDDLPSEDQWESVVTWDSNTNLGDDEVEVPFLKDIELACGDGAHSEQDYNGFKLRFSKATLRRFNAPSDGSTIFCFPAKGDSMEPVIPEGSTVTINIADKQIVDGKVYAINQDGWKRLKQLYRTGPNKVSIRSYNQTYSPEEANLDEIEIIGRAVHFSVML